MLEAERVLSVSFGAQLLKLGQGRPSQLPAGLLRALRSLVLPPLARLRRPGLPVSLLPEPGRTPSSKALVPVSGDGTQKT